MPNYNFSSTNNTHTPLPEPSLSRYSKSDSKQFVEIDITKSPNIDIDYRTDRHLQKAHTYLPDVETYVVNEQENVSRSIHTKDKLLKEIESYHLSLKGFDLIQEARVVL